MAINRKSLIQILVLVLLVVVGAGGFLYQQEGGLGFLGELLGGSTPPPSPPVTSKPTRKADSAAMTASSGEKSRPEAPAIPSQPARGEIQKAPFVVESAEIENGVLTLRQGKEPLSTEVKLFLKTKPWQTPSERSFKLGSQTSAPDSPLIRIRWLENGQKAPRQRDFTEKYTLQLELGREQDRKVPGKILLTLPDEDKSQIGGTFTADVKGFRFVDGKPDLSADSIDTLQYLALREVLKDDPDKAINNLVFVQGRYGSSAGGVPTGYVELEYKVGDASTGQKFQFAKEQGAWRLIGTLKPDQLDEAHPQKVPGPKDAPERLFPYLAAKWIEKDVQKRMPGRSLNATDFTTRYNEKQKIGISEVGYKVGGDGQAMQTSFLYRMTPNGWVLSRELGRKERVNLATGKVITER